MFFRYDIICLNPVALRSIVRNCRSAAFSASVLPDVELLDELLFVVEERVEAAEDLALPELFAPVQAAEIAFLI